MGPSPHLGKGSKDGTVVHRHTAQYLLSRGQPGPTEAGWRWEEGGSMRMGSSFQGGISYDSRGAGSTRRDISIPQSPSVTLGKQNNEEPVKGTLHGG